MNLNWIGYIIGKHGYDKLTPANKVKVVVDRMDRQKCVDSGRVPVKPWHFGIVSEETDARDETT